MTKKLGLQYEHPRQASIDSCLMDNTAKEINALPAIASADDFQKTDWQTLLANSLTSADQLAAP